MKVAVIGRTSYTKRLRELLKREFIIKQFDGFNPANLNKFDYSIGLNNILSQKKWETGLIEKNKISGYFNISIDLFRSIVLFSEYNTESNFILGSEIKFLDIFSLRFGTNDIEDFSFGVGLILKNISLDYIYKENSNNILGNNHILGFILDLK